MNLSLDNKLSPPRARAGSPANEVFEIEINVRNAAKRRGDPPEITDFVSGVLQMVAENLERMTPQQVRDVLRILGDIRVPDYLDLSFWHNLGMAVDYQFKEQLSFIQRRMRGEFRTDPYGLDPELIDRARPFLRFMYRIWWRTCTEGAEHIPPHRAGTAGLQPQRRYPLGWRYDCYCGA